MLQHAAAEGEAGGPVGRERGHLRRRQHALTGLVAIARGG